MYAVVFEKGKDPVVWKTVSGWPGTLHLQKDVYVYFTNNNSWSRGRKSLMISEETVPPEHRAFILLLK